MTHSAPSSSLLWPARILTLLVLVAAVFIGVKWWNQAPTKPDLDTGKAAVESFLTTIREGKSGQAWDSASIEFKSIAGRESFVRLVQATPLLQEPLQFGSLQDVSVQDKSRSEYLYQSPKSGSTVRVLLGYERGTWKVDRLTF